MTSVVEATAPSPSRTAREQAVAWAWQQATPLSSGAGRVLQALAREVNTDSWRCWPPLRKIAEETGLQPKQVRRHLVGLEGAGLIGREPHLLTGTRDKWGAACYTLSVFGTRGYLRSKPMPDGMTLRPPAPVLMWPGWYACPNCGRDVEGLDVYYDHMVQEHGYRRTEGGIAKPCGQPRRNIDRGATPPFEGSRDPSLQGQARPLPSRGGLPLPSRGGLPLPSEGGLPLPSRGGITPRVSLDSHSGNGRTTRPNINSAHHT